MFDIEVVRSRQEPARIWTFLAEIVGISDFVFYIDSIDFSYDGMLSDEVFRVNRKYKFPVRTDSPIVTIAFYETEDNYVQKTIENWKSTIKDEESGTFSYPSEYKTSIMVYDFNIRRELQNKIEIYGVFPSSGMSIRRSYSESGRLYITQVFSADGVRIIG